MADGSDVTTEGPWTILVARSGRRVDDQEPRIAGDREVEVVPMAEVERLREDLRDLAAQRDHLSRRAIALTAEVERLREDLRKAIQL